MDTNRWVTDEAWYGEDRVAQVRAMLNSEQVAAQATGVRIENP